MNQLVPVGPAQPLPEPVGRLVDPRRDIRAGAIIAALFFVLFLGWAAVARLDAAAHATGTLIVSGQRQSVQHRDGGVVGAMHVREGQRVGRGDLLISLVAPEVQAQERALTSQAMRLLAVRARLETEQAGGRSVPVPAEYAAFGDADRAEARRVLGLQQVELRARASTLAAQRGALGARVAQSGAQGRGFSGQTTSTDDQIRLVDEQIQALKPVAEKGFVSQTRMRELERLKASLEGQRAQYDASVTAAAGSGRESELMRAEAVQSFRERVSADLREVEQQLGDVMPRLAAAREQLRRTEIRAPVSGTVVGLAIFTPGGVVSAGQKLMDIVPEATPLVVQAQVPPEHADDLTSGMRAEVKFSGIRDRSVPELHGQLTRVSADSFIDEATGQRYFTAEVVVPRSELNRLRDGSGRPYRLSAGMPVEVIVPLRSRTALDYFLEPLTSQFWGALREE